MSYDYDCDYKFFYGENCVNCDSESQTIIKGRLLKMYRHIN